MLEAVFSRGPKLEYKSQEQAKGFSLSRELLSEAFLSLLVLKDAILYNRNFLFEGAVPVILT